MRLAVPLSSPDELKLLKDSGADEVYFGILEDSWRNIYGGHDSISRRQGAANLQNREELQLLADACQKYGISASMALNARVTPGQMDYLLKLCEHWAGLGGHGVIVRDIGLMLALKKEGFPLRVTASLLSVAVNAPAVEFLSDLGISRIVFPRFLKPGEMKDIAGAFPKMEFEAMIMGDKCPMIDGFCKSFHGETYRFADGEDLICGKRHCFDLSGTSNHLCRDMQRDPDPCAACLLSEFQAAGIRTGKLGGRGTPLSVRLKMLNFCHLADQGMEKREIIRLYRRVFGHGCNCYYL